MRKDGKLKAQATQSYSGSAQKAKQACWVRRGDVESLRRLVKDPAKCLDKLVADGLCEKLRYCSHCGSGEVRRSQCQRGARNGHLFVSCAKCRKYTNCVFYSPFRYSRSTAAEIVEFLDCYQRQNLLSRPTSSQLNRELGFGRTKLDHLIQTCLKAESLVGKDRSRKMMMKAGAEVDAHAVKLEYYCCYDDDEYDDIAYHCDDGDDDDGDDDDGDDDDGDENESSSMLL